MSVNLAADLHTIADRFGKFGELGLADAEAVFTHPEGAAVISAIAKVAGYNVPPGTITAFGSAFTGFLNAIVPPANGAPQTA